MDREAWRAAVHGVAKSWTRLSNKTELNPLMEISFPPPLQLLVTNILYFSHCFYEFDLKKNFFLHVSEIIQYLSLSDLFHLA